MAFVDLLETQSNQIKQAANVLKKHLTTKISIIMNYENQNQEQENQQGQDLNEQTGGNTSNGTQGGDESANGFATSAGGNGDDDEAGTEFGDLNEQMEGSDADYAETETDQADELGTSEDADLLLDDDDEGDDDDLLAEDGEESDLDSNERSGGAGL
jgi:hypothetical protein